MMRRAFNHHKVHDLAEQLGVSLAHARGILESLWHVTAAVTPRGDIGAHRDDRIAALIGETAIEGARLVEALVASGWLDRCQTHRLVVHDWHEHADRSLKGALKRQGIDFVVAQGAHPSGLGCATYSPRFRPCQSQSQKPEPDACRQTREAPLGDVDSEQEPTFASMWARWPTNDSHPLGGRGPAENAWNVLGANQRALAARGLDGLLARIEGGQTRWPTLSNFLRPKNGARDSFVFEEYVPCEGGTEVVPSGKPALDRLDLDRALGGG